MTTAAVDRSDRSVDRAIGSIDSIDSINVRELFNVFSSRWPRHARKNQSRTLLDLSVVKVSAPYDAWRPKNRRKTKTKKFGFFVKFDSIDSIIRSIRSIMRRWAKVDRPEHRVYELSWGSTPETKSPDDKYCHQGPDW